MVRKARINVFKVVAMYDTPVTASLIVAAGIHLTGLSNITSPAFWIAVAPIVYLIWVIVLLTVNRFATIAILHFYPKPRSVIAEMTDPAYLTMAGAGVCYLRWQMVRSLPLVSAHMGGCRWLRRFVMRSYAGDVRCDKACLLSEFPLDPDLLEVGEGTVLGGESTLTAHAFNTLPDGRAMFASAPIRIGKNVTIGAGSRVEMGCQIGDGAALEPGSVLAPFTLVGENEIWSGVPATFRRLRTMTTRPEKDAEVAASLASNVSAMSNGHPNGHFPSSSPTGRELAVKLIRSALGAERELNEWDSLDQMAIALAIHTHTGRPVPADEMFQLRTIEQVMSLLQETRSAVSAPQRQASPLPVNPELLPLWNRRDLLKHLAADALHSPDNGQHTALKALPVRLAASFTADFLQQPIERLSRRFGIAADVKLAGFNQIPQTLLDPDSLFANNEGGVNVILLAADDLPKGKEVDYLDRLLESIEVFLRNSSPQARLCLCTMPVAVSLPPSETPESVTDARNLWNSRITTLPQVDVIPFAQVVDSNGASASYDPQLHDAASCPYTMDVLNDCAVEIVRSIRKAVRPRAKVIAVDCDHTLWGGVVGEVGTSGIDLGDGPHGRHHLALQQWIRAKKDEGILIAIVSRNEEADVWSVFDTHPNMILQKNDIVAHRINWHPKSQNLKSLAEELNLGLDSFVFLDDDPAVRLEVATSLPEVTVVPLEDPARFVETVDKLWAFDAVSITSDDRRRTEMMIAERERKATQNRHHSLDEYLAELQLQVIFKEADESDLPRVAQLIQKTNQFNLSTIRRTLEEVSLMTDANIFVASVSDRFGDYGSVGVVILCPNDGHPLLDTFLLSCRVLGRHVENAILAAIREICLDLGGRTLQATVAVTPRNEPARQFMKEAGFTPVSATLWEWPLSTAYVCPPQITLTIQRHGGNPPADRKPLAGIATAHA